MSAYSTLILGDTPAAYWRLGEASGNWIDSSGNAHDLTPSGTFTYAASGLLLNGDTDKAASFTAGQGDAVGWKPTTVPFSVEAWVKPASVTGALPFWSEGGTGQGFKAGISATGSRWSFTTLGVLEYLFTATAAVGSIYHVVFIYHTDFSVDLYLNGAFSQTITSGTGAITPTTQVQIGAVGSTPEYFNGVIDEAAMYGFALSAAQVSAHFSAGSYLPASPRAYLARTAANF